MSINDPIEAAYNERHKKWYIKQGNETYYDPITDEWALFYTKEGAELFIRTMKLTKFRNWNKNFRENNDVA